MPDTQGGLKRRRRWRRVVIAGVILLAAVAAAVFLGSGPRLDAWARARLRAELARALGRPVSVGEVHVALASSSFVANDIVVGEVPPGKGRVLEVPQVAGTIRLRSLLRNRLEIVTLHVIGPRVVFAHRGERLEGPIPVRRRGPLMDKATGALKIVLRRLEVENGTVSFDDHTAPFWCRAEGLELLWQGDELGNGSGTLQTENVTGGSGDVAQLGSLRVQAVLQAGDLTGRLEGTWPAGSARLQAAITLPSAAGEPATGSVRGEVHLEESARSSLITSLLHLDERLEGSVDVRGSLQFRGSEWRGQGSLDARRVRYAELFAETASMQVHAADGIVTLRDVDLRTLGGRVTGTARIAAARNGAFTASAHADGLSLQDVLGTLGLASPLTGAASGDGELAMTLGDPDSLTVRATTRVSGGGPPRGGPPSTRRFPVSGEGRLTIEKKLVVFTSERVSSGGVITSLRVEKQLGVPETRVRLDGTLAALSEGSQMVESFLAGQPDGGPLPWESSRLGGSGSLEGELVFRKDTPARGRVEFAFRDFTYEGIGGAILAGTALADGSELTFTVPRAENDGGTMALEGRFPQARHGGARITGELTDWPLDDVLARLGAPKGATLRGSGPVTYRFDAAASGGETRLSLTNARVGDVVFTSGEFEATMRGRRIDVARLALAGPQATVTASGSYAIDAAELTGTLEASHVDAAVVSPWLEGASSERPRVAGDEPAAQGRRARMDGARRSRKRTWRSRAVRSGRSVSTSRATETVRGSRACSATSRGSRASSICVRPTREKDASSSSPSPSRRSSP